MPMSTEKLVDAVDISAVHLQNCGLVVLALPLDQLITPNEALVQAMPPGAVITDMGSVKAPVAAALASRLPRFVPSHPMAGTERMGVSAARANLFENAVCVITPTPESHAPAVE